MIPIRDSQWRRNTPYVTRALIILNIFIFLAMLAMNDDGRSVVVITSNQNAEALQGGNGLRPPFQPYTSSPRKDFTLRFGAVPEFITGYVEGNHHAHDVVESHRFSLDGRPVERAGIGLLDGLLLLLTPLTAMFIHGGFLHLAGNMLFLWVFADNVEDRMGRWRFALFYLIAGYLAAAAHIWIDRSDLVPLIGASGAISAVLGAYLILFPRAKVQVLIPIILLIPAVIPAPLMIGFWFLTNLINSVGSVVSETSGSGGTAWFAHLGGFLAGIFLVYPFLIGRWRAPVGEVGPIWSLPSSITEPFRRRRLTSIEIEEEPGIHSAHRAIPTRLARWRLIRRRSAGGIEAYRRPPPHQRP